MTMTFVRKLALAGLAPLAGLSLATGAAVADTGTPTPPPWEPATQYTRGVLNFYDANGNIVTSGPLQSPLFSYAAASTPGPTGYTKATLYFAAPSSTTPIAQWYKALESSSTAYPVSSPSSLAADPNPVVSLTSGDADVNAFTGGYTADSNPSYGDLIQLRMVASGPGKPTTTTYWDGDIAFNQGTAPITVDNTTVQPGTWAQVYPTPVAPPTSVPEVGLPIVLGLSGVAVLGGAVLMTGRRRRA